MKKVLLMIVLCIFLMQGIGWGAYEFNGRWVETKCEICGKTIYEWLDTDISYYGNTGMITFSYPPGEKKKTIYLKNITVCPECREKYKKEFKRCIDKTLKKIIETEDVKFLRKKHEIQRQQRQMKDLLNQVESLGKQIDQIRKEINK